MNIFDVMKRANEGTALTPMERAVLKAMLAALVSSLSLLLPYLNDILDSRVTVDWPHVIEVIVYAMILAGAAKILGTLNPSDQATAQRLQQKEQDLERSEVGSITPVVPPTPPPNGGVFSAPTIVPPIGPGGIKPILPSLTLPGASTIPFIVPTDQPDPNKS